MILLSASWNPGPAFTLFGITVEIQNLMRDCVMVAVTLASLLVTRKIDRSANGFSWGPMLEVAKLFASIFITIIPVLAMLKAGSAGVFAPLQPAVARIHRALKQAFDPAGIMNPGKVIG